MRYLRLLSLLCLMPLSAFGDVSASVVEVAVKYNVCEPATFFTRATCKELTSHGSGVIIGTLNGLPVLATCNHVVEKHIYQQSLACTVRISDQWHGVKVIGYSERLDLALLQVQMAGLSEIEAAEIEEQPELTADVQIVGFPQGRFTKVKAKYKSRSRIRRGGQMADALVANQPTDQGQSGGGLFSGDRLAGIVFATSKDESYSTSGAELAKMARHYKVKLKAKSRGVIAPPPPPEVSPSIPPPNWQPDPEITKQLREISIRLAAIEAKAAVPGPVGPPGPPGPAGPAGKDADTAAIDKRLSALEQRGQTVQIFDAGKLISEQTYAPGSPIKIQFNPVK